MRSRALNREALSRGRRPPSKMVTNASAICAPVRLWSSRYQCAIQLSAPPRRPPGGAQATNRRRDLPAARHEALEQQLLLAGDVVIHGGLGDLEPGGDVIERGVVVALVIELAGGGANHRLALHRAVAQ